MFVFSDGGLCCRSVYRRVFFLLWLGEFWVLLFVYWFNVCLLVLWMFGWFVWVLVYVLLACLCVLGDGCLACLSLWFGA